MKKVLLALLLVLAAGAVVYLVFPRRPARPHLRLYSGAGLRRAVEKLAAAFEAETGARVEADYGGSGLVLSRSRDDATADLFLPGDVWYVDRLEELTPGRVAARATVAYFVPTIIVARGNPKGIKGLTDLGRAGVRLGLGKSDACQIGRVSAKILSGVGLKLAELKPQESLTVNELGVWVKMKNVDAAVVWEAIAANLGEDVETVAIPPEKNSISEVVLARLSGSTHPEEADRFLEFVRGPKGQEILRATGYSVKRPPAPAAGSAPDAKSGAISEDR
jgi:molybdate transport system substrate-binding protein